MSGGGGGVIIIKRLASSDGISPEDRAALYEIADRTVVRCSTMDAMRVLSILWRYLR